MRPALVTDGSAETGAGLMHRIREIGSADRTERRGSPPIAEPQAPAILHIDVADALDAASQSPVVTTPRPPAPMLDAMELQLLACARQCAAGDASQPPRRDLVAVALREALREQAFRDDAEAQVLELQRSLKGARDTRLDLFKVMFELMAFVRMEHDLGNAQTDEVLTFIRAQRASAERTTPAARAGQADGSVA